MKLCCREEPFTTPFITLGSVSLILTFACHCFCFYESESEATQSHVRLFVTLWTVAYQTPPSMGFSGQEYWSRLPFPSPGDLPDPGIEPGYLALQADALTSEPPGNIIGNPSLLPDC